MSDVKQTPDYRVMRVRADAKLFAEVSDPAGCVPRLFSGVRATGSSLEAIRQYVAEWLAKPRRIGDWLQLGDKDLVVIVGPDADWEIAKVRPRSQYEVVVSDSAAIRRAKTAEEEEEEEDVIYDHREDEDG